MKQALNVLDKEFLNVLKQKPQISQITQIFYLCEIDKMLCFSPVYSNLDKKIY